MDLPVGVPVGGIEEVKMNPKLKPPYRAFLATPTGWVFCAFVAIALFLLIAEHRAHLGFVVPYLPFALMGVCIALHWYMHGTGHGSSSDETREDESGRRDHHHH